MTRPGSDGADLLGELCTIPGSLVDYPCPCPPLPLNYWHHPARGWDEGRPIRGDGSRQAAQFNAHGYDGWVIACPDCGLVYATGWEAGP
jgi:hypothetical protein